MKKLIILSIFALGLLINTNAQVAINTDGSSPDATAMLDVSSTSKGILIPRLTQAQIKSISNPAQGLMVFEIEDSTFYYYDNSNWTRVGNGASGWYRSRDTISAASGYRVVLGNTSPEGKLTLSNSNEATTLKMANEYSGVSTTLYGIDNSVQGSSDKIIYGMKTQLTGTSSGTHYGNYVQLNVSGDGIHYGNYLSTYGSGDGNHYGSYNYFGDNGNGTHYGYYASLAGSGGGKQYGGKINISNTGNATHYGLYNYLSGSGTGSKYGIYSAISSSAGGTHYGAYVQAEGSGNYSGYFRGRMYISDSTGIGVTNPVTKLDVDGPVKVGYGTASGSSHEGMIRWNGTTREFEGYTGTEWISLSKSNDNWGENTATETQGVTASDGAANDNLGYSVSVSGDYAIAGAFNKTVSGNTYQGEAYIFHYSNGSWTQQAILTASDGTSGDHFGNSVSISGNYAIVGAYQKDVGSNANQGKAYIFYYNGSSWSQQKILTGSGGAAGDAFGVSVSIDGDYAVAGANYKTVTYTNQGAAYVFHRNGTSWDEQITLTASDANLYEDFGEVVSISGDYIIVSDPEKTVGGNSNQGKVYIFHRDGTSWTEQTNITATDGTASDYYGRGISISEDYAVVGAPEKDVRSNNNQGKVYVYQRSGTLWAEQTTLTARDGNEYDKFGYTVGISEYNIIVGAYPKEVGNNGQQGKAYIFHYNGSSWIQSTSLISSDGATQDDFGGSVSISGDNSVVGAWFKDIGSNSHQGKVYFFMKN